MDATGKEIVDIMSFEERSEPVWVGKGEPGTLIIDKATLKVEDEGFIFDEREATVLVGAVGEDLI